jgi:hypothetical protein
MPGQFGQPPLPNTVTKTMAHFCPGPSASMNEATLGQIAPGDFTMQLGYEALKAVRVAGENTTTACRAIHADTTLSEGARHVSADAVSFKVTNKALPLVDKATQNFATEIQRLKNKVAAPPQDNTIRGVQLATELRIFLRDQSSADRRKEITRSVEQGDDQTMSAILSAPPMLSGLSEPEVSGFRLMWQQKRWPDEMKRIGVLEKALAAVQLGGTLLDFASTQDGKSWHRCRGEKVSASECRCGPGGDGEHPIMS